MKRNEILGPINLNEEEYDYYRDYKAGLISYDEYQNLVRRFQDRERSYRPRPSRSPEVQKDYHLRNTKTGRLLSKDGQPSVFSSERHAMAVAAKLKFGSWEPVPAGKGVAEGVVRIKVSELSVNRNTTVHKWQLRSDKNFGLINEVPSVILKNVSVSIDQNAYDNDRKIFAYLQGEKTDSVPRGLKSFPIVYQRNGTYPFIDKSTGDPIENVAYVEFTDQGKVIGYQQGVTEGSKIPMVKDPETGRKHPDYGNTGIMRDLAAAAQKRKTQPKPTEPNTNDLSKYNDFPDTNKHSWMPVMIGEPSWANIPKSLEVWARRKGIHRDIDISHDPEGKIWTIKGKSGYPHDTEYTYRWEYNYDDNQFEPVEQGVAEGDLPSEYKVKVMVKDQKPVTGTVRAGSPNEAKKKAIAAVKKNFYNTHGYEVYIDSVKILSQGVAEGPEENKKWRDQARDASKEKRPWSPTNLPNYKKNKEQGVAEGKMDPEKRARLKDLIDQFSDSVDPSDYASYLDPDEIIDTIRQEFGDRIADQVRSGAEKMHFGRGYGYSGMGDILSKNMRGNTGDYRVTKGGKMHRSDVNALKSRIKSANYRPFGTKKPALPEEIGYDEITPKSASYILRKMEQGVPMSEILVDFPELGRKMEIIAGELGLHPDDDFEDIEAALYHELEDMVDQNDRDVEEADSQLQVKQIDKATGNVTAMDPKTQQTTQLKAADLKPDATKPGSFTATMTDPNEVKPGATITAKTAEAVHRQQGANPMGQDELGSTYTQSTISGDEDHDEVTKLLTNRLRQLAGLE